MAVTDRRSKDLATNGFIVNSPIVNVERKPEEVLAGYFGGSSGLGAWSSKIGKQERSAREQR